MLLWVPKVVFGTFTLSGIHEWPKRTIVASLYKCSYKNIWESSVQQQHSVHTAMDRLLNTYDFKFTVWWSVWIMDSTIRLQAFFLLHPPMLIGITGESERQGKNHYYSLYQPFTFFPRVLHSVSRKSSTTFFDNGEEEFAVKTKHAMKSKYGWIWMATLLVVSRSGYNSIPFSPKIYMNWILIFLYQSIFVNKIYVIRSDVIRMHRFFVPNSIVRKAWEWR